MTPLSQRQPSPRRVLMCEPTHFRVDYAINPHMRDADGRLQEVDPAAARRQWQALAEAYRTCGIEVVSMAADAGLPDQVFTANIAFTFPAPEGCGYVAAIMADPRRTPEVALAGAALEQAGCTLHELDARKGPFEGGGDLLWAHGHHRLLGGHGFRSTEASLRAAAEIAGVPVDTFRLVDERFYHLDTCLCPLDGETAIWVPEAFDADGQDRIRELFPQLIEPPHPEALGFAANADCPDGRHVLIDAQCTQTIDAIGDAGFVAVPVDTSEFRKSGGSVTCMRQPFW